MENKVQWVLNQIDSQKKEISGRFLSLNSEYLDQLRFCQRCYDNGDFDRLAYQIEDLKGNTRTSIACLEKIKELYARGRIPDASEKINETVRYYFRSISQDCDVMIESLISQDRTCFDGSLSEYKFRQLISMREQSNAGLLLSKIDSRTQELRRELTRILNAEKENNKKTADNKEKNDEDLENKEKNTEKKPETKREQRDSNHRLQYYRDVLEKYDINFGYRYSQDVIGPKLVDRKTGEYCYENTPNADQIEKDVLFAKTWVGAHMKKPICNSTPLEEYEVDGYNKAFSAEAEMAFDKIVDVFKSNDGKSVTNWDLIEIINDNNSSKNQDQIEYESNLAKKVLRNRFENDIAEMYMKNIIVTFNKEAGSKVKVNEDRLRRWEEYSNYLQ